MAAGALILKPAPASYRSSDLQAQFSELTSRAESLVSEATGLHSAHGTARAKVTDRAGWAAANVRSIERLVGPALVELQRKRGAKLGGASLAVGRAVAGTQLGLMLAYMATRVLGQYDLLIDDEAPEDQDLVSYVGPNIVAVEEKYGFVPSQFRLWLALHEVTHRLQFTAVPWLRDHFVGLVSELLGPLSGDPAGFAEMVRRAATEVRAGRNPTREAGVLGMLATPEQRVALSKISGMMSLLEGHGDVTMDRAGAAEVPGAAHFSKVLHERRTQARGLTKLMSKLLGLDAKMRQYAEGERFVESVEATGGPALLARVWEGPEWLPTLEEIRDPRAGWTGPVGEEGPTTSTALVSDLLTRCTFPAAGTPLPCAVSGGADSLALLVLARAARCEVTAIHVEHGLRAGSDAEADVVADAARRFGARFESRRVSVASGPNLEARARAARSAVLPRGVATGHTMDDQAETILVNLLRGAGADGLAGMEPGSRHPLLGLRRRETHALCAAVGLVPVCDPSNADPAFVRNRVRHELLPLCAQVAGRDPVPRAGPAGRRVARRGGAARPAGRRGAARPRRRPRQLAGTTAPLARRALRRWLRDETGTDHPPSLAEVERTLAVARGAAEGTELSGAWRVRRTDGRLRVGAGTLR